MEVRVLGALTLDDGRIPLSRRDRAVLSALTVRLGTSLSTGSLAAAVWGDEVPASGQKVIQGCVMRLRRLIAPARIETTSLGYRLLAEHVEVDADRFERLVQRGTEMLELGEPDRAAHTFAEALALWRGEAYDELIDWPPARIASGRLDELRLSAEELLLDAELQAGRVEEVAAWARTRVAEAPLRERRWIVLSVAQYRQGRQADALATVRHARSLLAAELGLDPGVDLAELEQAILRQDPALLSDRAFRAGSAECPYFGLPPAEIEDADRYFGREQELAEALRMIDEHGVLLIAGASGVGKSSFVRAGIAAHLRADGAEVFILTPGEHPVDAIRDVDLPGAASVLIVDQCEQVFAADDPSATRQFFAQLARLVFRGTLVIALRADRLGDLAEQPGFAQIIRSRMLMLTQLGSDGLRAIIEKPAEQAGLILEPGLTEVLVRDADGRSLPLLSHALRQVWLRREGRVMTVDGYRASGEIEGSVAQTAEEVYADLSDEQRGPLRDILLRLVDVTDGVANGHRVERALVAIDEAHARIIDRLVDARLITTDQESVQLSHEALAREWPRLTEWLARDIEGQRIMRHLATTAIAWDAMGRPHSELYRGSRLLAAQQWQDASSPSLTTIEREFMEMSAEHEKAELSAAQTQLRRERRMVRRLTWVSAGAAGLAIVAIGASVFAGIQTGIAGEAAIATTARRVAEVAVDEPKLDRALLLAVQAIQLHDTHEARVSLMEVLARAPGAISVEQQEPTNLATYDDLDRVSRDPEYSADGSLLAVPMPVTPQDASWGRIELWRTAAADDAAPLSLVLQLRGRDPVTEIVSQVVIGFSPDSSRLYAAGSGPVAVFDTATGAQVDRLPGRGLLAVSHDGHRLVIGKEGPAVQIVDPSGITEPVTIPLPGPPIRAALSPDGSLLAVADSTRSIHLVNIESGQVAQILREHDDIATEVEFQSDRELMTVAGDGEAITWDIGDWSKDFRRGTFRVKGSFGEHSVRALRLPRPDGHTEVITADAAAWEKRACDVAGRTLTEEEWRAYIGAIPYDPACRG